MTNDEMMKLAGEFHKTEDLYQLNWLKEYLEARIQRYTKHVPLVTHSYDCVCSVCK